MIFQNVALLARFIQQNEEGRVSVYSQPSCDRLPPISFFSDWPRNKNGKQIYPFQKSHVDGEREIKEEWWKELRPAYIHTFVSTSSQGRGNKKPFLRLTV